MTSKAWSRVIYMSGVLFAMSWGIIHAQSERPELQVDPLLGNPQAIAAGETIYNQSCAVCHGTGARGDRGPSLLSGSFAHGGAHREILLSIRRRVPPPQTT